MREGWVQEGAGRFSAQGITADPERAVSELPVTHSGKLDTALFMGAVFRDGPDDPTIDRDGNKLEEIK